MDQAHRSNHPLFPPHRDIPDDEKPPFIANQGLRVLRTKPGVDAFGCLNPTKFRVARRKVEDTGKHASVELSDECWWEEITTPLQRQNFLANLGEYDGSEFRRLVLVIEAGTGKTVAACQTMYLRSCLREGHLAIGCRFSELPTEVDKYLEGESPFLCERFRFCEETMTASNDLVRRLILRKIDAGEFTLVVDAFDQVSKTREPESQRSALRTFLDHYPKVRVVCTGRPNSIVNDGKGLFESGGWTFAQIVDFTPDQQKDFAGEDRIAALRNMEVQVLSQPRMLEAVRMLHPEELTGLRTAAALHIKVIDHVVARALREQAGEYPISLLLRLVSAVAFQMHVEENYDGVPAGDEFDKFVNNLFKQRGKGLTDHFDDKNEIRKGLKKLAELNELLDFAFLEDGQQTQIYFRNRTIQDLFAALWVTRYSSRDSELKFLQERVYLDGDGFTWPRHVELKEMWQFLTDMPGKLTNISYIDPAGNVRNDVNYVRALSTLFLPLDRDENPIERELIGSRVDRSPEMLYRGWWQLMEIAFERRFRHESEMTEATRKMQWSIREQVDKGKAIYQPNCPLPANESDAAKFLVEQFLSEFLAIRNGLVGNSEQSIVAQEVDRFIDKDETGFGFLKIPKGKFWFGDEHIDDNRIEEFIEEIDEDFYLARYPATNEQFRLFDPLHGMRGEQGKDHVTFTTIIRQLNMRLNFIAKPAFQFVDYERYSGHVRCPAIFVSWYAGQMCAFFFHSEIPSNEFQWERACRGEQQVPEEARTFYCFGNNGKIYEDPNAELGRYAYFDVNSERRTHLMGPNDDEKLPNNFGLMHMHGMVCEWTSSWYCASATDGYNPAFISKSRVLRGGSFLDEADDCESANRISTTPTTQSCDTGIRFSRARRS